MSCFFEHDNEPLGAIRDGEFLCQAKRLMWVQKDRACPVTNIIKIIIIATVIGKSNTSAVMQYSKYISKYPDAFS
jgi:hypothetical protein